MYYFDYNSKLWFFRESSAICLGSKLLSFMGIFCADCKPIEKTNLLKFLKKHFWKQGNGLQDWDKKNTSRGLQWRGYVRYLFYSCILCRDHCALLDTPMQEYSTMRKNLPKTLEQLIFCKCTLNVLKFTKHLVNMGTF